MIWEKVLLATSLLAVLYTWMGYPLALWLLRALSRKESCAPAHRPLTFSVVIAVHNEAAQMAAKLDDCLALDYPQESLEIVVVSDGSVDASGAACAIRRDLSREIAPHFGDDCVLPLDVCRLGFRVMQEPQAVVFDEMPHTIGGELHTRVRMTARSCAGTLSLPQLLNPLR